MKTALEEISNLATFNGMLHEDEQKLDLAVRIGRVAAIADTALHYRYANNESA